MLHGPLLGGPCFRFDGAHRHRSLRRAGQTSQTRALVFDSTELTDIAACVGPARPARRGPLFSIRRSSQTGSRGLLLQGPLLGGPSQRAVARQPSSRLEATVPERRKPAFLAALQPSRLDAASRYTHPRSYSGNLKQSDYPPPLPFRRRRALADLHFIDKLTIRLAAVMLRGREGGLWPRGGCLLN